MKPSIRWPLGISLLLASFVAVNLYLMHVANDDPSFAIEPDYYKKAVGFDSTMAQEKRSATLGWSATSVIGQAAPGKAEVAVTINDATHRPITGAAVTIVARYNARANDTQSATLRESSPGEYTTPITIAHGGEWEITVDAVRGTEHYVASTRAQAPLVTARVP